MNADTLIAAAAGVLFGVGLAISGMVDPTKVKDFLDVAAIGKGGWDPSLAFVMVGAIIVAMPAFRSIGGARRQRATGPAGGPGGRIDSRLIGGSALFGVGWGLAGLCPGPAIADLALAPLAVLGFVAAMLAGSWATGVLLRRSSGRVEVAGDVPAE